VRGAVDRQSLFWVAPKISDCVLVVYIYDLATGYCFLLSWLPSLLNTETKQKCSQKAEESRGARIQLMFENIWQDVAMAVGFFHVVGPIALRSTFRFATRCEPVSVTLEEMSPETSSQFAPRIPQMQSLGFELIGCYNCGEMASDAKSFVAYFVNRQTNDFSNVTEVVSPGKVAGYFEFSTRLTNGTRIETNTNSILPLTPNNPDYRVFRFPKISEPQALYDVHRQLLAKYATGFGAQGEPLGQEIQRLVRVVEQYGARHEKIGYMYLADGGAHYRLTWKGACLMTWRALWPTVLVRRILYRQQMNSELQELHLSGETALQKA
jgi:hypothetical protein